MCHIQLTPSCILFGFPLESVCPACTQFAERAGDTLTQRHFSVCNLSDVKMVRGNSRFCRTAGNAAHFVRQLGKMSHFDRTVTDYTENKIDTVEIKVIFNHSLLSYIYTLSQYTYTEITIFIITAPFLIITPCALDGNNNSKQWMKPSFESRFFGMIPSLFCQIKPSLLYSPGNTGH